MFEVVLLIVGLGFAAWALLPPASTEQIRAMMATRPKLLIWISIAVFVITLAYPFGTALIPASCPILRSLAPAIEQLVIVLLIAGAAVVVWRRRRWTEEQLRWFHRRVEPLILTGRASSVVDVLYTAFPNLPRRRIPKTDDGSAFAPSDFETCFDEVLGDALAHVEFIRAAARHNRRFLARTLSLQSNAGLFASDRILAELMFGPDRLLPRELAATTIENGERAHFYWIPERCIILHALLDDIAFADQTACWKPIGEGVIRHVAGQAGHAANDPDQQPFVQELEKSRWSSPVGAGIWFFRVMATSAAKQGQTWHMWLPYLAHFVHQIDAIIEIPEQKSWKEFPNQYCYWVYDCVSCCGDVARMASIVEEGNPNWPSTLDSDQEQYSVVSGALYTYGLCLASILKSTRLPDRFKVDRVEGLCLDYQAWESKAFPEGMAAFSVRMIQSGISTDDRKKLREYVEGVVKSNSHKDAYTRLLAALQQNGHNGKQPVMS